MPESHSQPDLVARLLLGDVRAAARLMRLVDDRAEGYLDILKALHPHTGKAYVIGITGSPGVGKSTLVDRLIEHYRAGGKKVGVLAVDPSSPFTGGAILGDRIRMQRHALDEQVFIRSLAARGQLGGLSRSLADVLRVLDAFGCEVILVETVGVGQGELDVARLAHTTLVVVAPGAGDEVQAIKAGILEVADVFAVNKADLAGAEGCVRDLEGMLALSESLVHAGSGRGHGAGLAQRARDCAARDGAHWLPRVVTTAALDGRGTAELAAVCAEHRAFLSADEPGARQLRQRELLELSYRELLLARGAALLEQARPEALAELAHGADPYTVAEQLVARLFREG